MNARIALEKQYLGLVLKRADVLLPELQPGDFSHPANGRVWKAILDCREDGGMLDARLVAARLEREGERPRLLEYVEHLAEHVEIDVETGLRYATELLNDGLDRRVNEGLAKIAQSNWDSERKRKAARQLLDDTDRTAPRAEKSTREYLLSLIDRMELLIDSGKLPGVATGLASLDEITGGLQGGDLTVVAARPSVGKTAFAVNLTHNVLESGLNVCFVSAEQGGDQIVQRIAGLRAGVSIQRLRNPKSLEDEEWSKFFIASKWLVDAPLRINDDPAPQISDLNRWALRHRHEMDLLVVDYIQRLRVADSRAKEHERAGECAMELKELARTLDVPVLALAQINREGHDEPKIQHIRGSGVIEQEADLIMLLHRDTYNAPESLRLLMGKNRHGPVGVLDLQFTPETMRIAE